MEVVLGVCRGKVRVESAMTYLLVRHHGVGGGRGAPRCVAFKSNERMSAFRTGYRIHTRIHTSFRVENQRFFSDENTSLACVACRSSHILC